MNGPGAGMHTPHPPGAGSDSEILLYSRFIVPTHMTVGCPRNNSLRRLLICENLTNCMFEDAAVFKISMACSGTRKESE
jgi:hypothetical protein